MTREEAATILYKEWQRFLEDNLDYAGISDAYKMAINTLKQETILEKIRADINNLTVYYITKDKRINLISQRAVNRVFDKYRKGG